MTDQRNARTEQLSERRSARSEDKAYEAIAAANNGSVGQHRDGSVGQFHGGSVGQFHGGSVGQYHDGSVGQYDGESAGQCHGGSVEQYGYGDGNGQPELPCRLPPGWEERWDNNYGSHYYNRLTDRWQYQYPCIRATKHVKSQGFK